MAATASPYGLKPAGLVGGESFSGAFKKIACTTNNTNAIFSFQPVNITAGVPTGVVTTSPTTTLGITTPVGICVGVDYVTPQGEQRYAQYLPAGAVTAGYTNIFIHVLDNPDALYEIQATAAVTAASIGLNAPMTYTAGSTFTGNSKWALTAASIAATSTLALRIIDLVKKPGSSTPGDAFTDCIVKWNFGVHAYLQATGQ